jgi:hypothetical protein
MNKIKRVSKPIRLLASVAIVTVACIVIGIITKKWLASILYVTCIAIGLKTIAWFDSNAESGEG